MDTSFTTVLCEDVDHIVTHVGKAWEDLRGGRLFIAGGTGFFGVWLLASLYAANKKLGLDCHATIPSRNPEAFLRRFPEFAADPRFTFISGDIRHFIHPKGQFTHVIHCASDTSRSMLEAPFAHMDTLIVTGSSGLGIEIFYSTFRNKRGQRIFLTSGLGAMGYGIPAVIGGAMAFGGNGIVGIESDGSLQMNIQELQTLRQHNLPIRLFIINNSGYASIRSTQRTYFEGRHVGTGPEAGLYLADPVAVASAMGIAAMRIDTVEHLREGIRHALAQRGPFLCDVHVMRDEAFCTKSAAIPPTGWFHDFHAVGRHVSLVVQRRIAREHAHPSDGCIIESWHGMTLRWT